MVKEIAAFQLDCAKKILQNEGHLIPVAFIICAGALKTILAVSFTNDEQKHLATLAIGTQAKALNADQVIFLNDGYIRQIDTSKLKDATDLELERPCYYPASMKKECITITIVDFKINKAETSIYKKEDNGIYSFEPSTPFTEGQGAIQDNIFQGYKK